MVQTQCTQIWFMIHNSNHFNKINIDHNKEMILNLIIMLRLTMTVCAM